MDSCVVTFAIKGLEKYCMVFFLLKKNQTPIYQSSDLLHKKKIINYYKTKLYFISLQI